MTANQEPCYCPAFHESIEMIGRRWTGPILLALFAERHRFCDIRNAIPGISDRLLAERLKELEAANVITRNAECRDISYQLTTKGLGLKPVIDQIVNWTRKDWAA